jgi:hypothetical protein
MGIQTHVPNSTSLNSYYIVQVEHIHIFIWRLSVISLMTALFILETSGA